MLTTIIVNIAVIAAIILIYFFKKTMGEGVILDMWVAPEDERH